MDGLTPFATKSIPSTPWSVRVERSLNSNEVNPAPSKAWRIPSTVIPFVCGTTWVYFSSMRDDEPALAFWASLRVKSVTNNAPPGFRKKVNMRVISSMEAKWWYDEAHYTETIGNHYRKHGNLCSQLQRRTWGHRVPQPLLWVLRRRRASRPERVLG